MSTFCGLFEEIPFISVDRFDGENLKSKLFFLSHCHADHMNGLFDSEGLPGPLYASSASVVFIKKQFPSLKSIHSLETDYPHEIEYEVDGKKYMLIVTLLSARHCPGSVMFLFQTGTCNILYTGDFRITRSDLNKNFSLLQEIPINVIYLDSTFMSKNFNEFPSQIESINAILQIISEWLDLNPKNKFFLDIPAQYGSEYLFIEIYRKLKQKIYIEKQQRDKYIYFPDMDECISDNEQDCRIHVLGRHNNDNLHSRYKRFIRPSALIWKKWKKGNAIVSNNYNNYRVVNSSHSSLLEIKDFLNFVKPKQVKLNVIPSNERERLVMYKTLNDIYPRLVTDAVESPIQYEKNVNFENIFICNKQNVNENCSPPTKKRLLPKRIKS